MDDQKPNISPAMEGLIGAGVGGVIGLMLSVLNIISPLAIIGVILGVGLGSWFNAWRRSRKNGDAH